MAAIALDAVASGEAGSAISLTYAHTCTGSNRILFVGVMTFDPADLVSGVTYAGVSMTRIATVQEPATTFRIYLYYLINPASGANNVVVSSSSSTTIRSSSTSYTGARQNSQPDASGTKQNTTTGTHTLAIVTVANNCWMVSWIQSAGSNPAASTGTTLRQGATARAIGDSNSAITPPGSYSMSWTTGTNDNSAVIQASFAPANDAAAMFFELI